MVNLCVSRPTIKAAANNVDELQIRGFFTHYYFFSVRRRSECAKKRLVAPIVLACVREALLLLLLLPGIVASIIIIINGFSTLDPTHNDAYYLFWINNDNSRPFNHIIHFNKQLKKRSLRSTSHEWQCVKFANFWLEEFVEPKSAYNRFSIYSIEFI